MSDQIYGKIYAETCDSLGPKIDQLRFVWALLLGERGDSPLFGNIRNGEGVARGLFEIMGEVIKEYDRIVALADPVAENGQ